MPNVSADIDTFLRSANNAAARTNLGAASTDANTFAGAQTISANGAASTPPLKLTGTIFTGGSGTTTKPALLVEPAGTTSTGWSTSGTGLGVNAPSGFTGPLADLQLNGVYRFRFFAPSTNYAYISAGQNAYETMLNFAANGLFVGNTSSSPALGNGFNVWMGNYNGAGVNIIGTGSYAFGDNTGNNLFSGRNAEICWGGATGSIQLGRNHATTATDQTFKAHNVTNGTAAKLTISGGNAATGTGGAVEIKGGTGTSDSGQVSITGGSLLANVSGDIDLLSGGSAGIQLLASGGAVILNGTNRTAYSNDPNDIAACLVAHGLMAPL